MRTNIEIRKELDLLIAKEEQLYSRLPESSVEYELAAVAAQALIWVLGEELSPLEMIEERD